MKTEKKKGNNLTCKSCGWKWVCNSKRVFVTCPSCQGKVSNKK